MSSTAGSAGSGLPEPPDLFPVQPILPIDQSAAALEAAYQNEQDKRREERFFWICVTSFFVDTTLFPGFAWHVNLMLFLFQIALLLALAKWLGLENVAVPLERLFNRYLAENRKKT